MDPLLASAKLRLENRVAVVTGGTRGIGDGIVRRFVQEGARVVFSGRSREKGKALEEEFRPNAAFYPADAASAADAEALMAFVVDRFGRLDCVVNNAGAGGESGPSGATSVEGFNQSIALLLGGTFLGIKYAVARMPSGGSIINIANAALWRARSESSFATGPALVVDGGLTAGPRRSQRQLRSDQLRERFRS